MGKTLNMILAATVASTVLITSSIETAVAQQQILEEKALVDDDPREGSKVAPITVVVFGDYRCPGCRYFDTQVLPQIREKYVKKGSVSIVYRDFAFLSEQSKKLAEAANCARDQGKFLEYHNKIYRNQKFAGSPAALIMFAGDLRLDLDAFSNCMDKGKYQAEVQRDFYYARQNGVNYAPTIFVNGKKIGGMDEGMIIPDFNRLSRIFNTYLKK